MKYSAKFISKMPGGQKFLYNLRKIKWALQPKGRRVGNPSLEADAKKVLTHVRQKGCPPPGGYKGGNRLHP
jgi:hypothetical protein